MFTTSLEVSKKLKEAGFEKPNGWAWLVFPDGHVSLSAPGDSKPIEAERYTAYNLGELIRELPVNTALYKDNKYPRSPGIWSKEYWVQVDEREVGEADTPEDACGLTLVELLKGERNSERQVKSSSE